MQRATAVIISAVALLGVSVALADRNAANPMQKVIQLLGDLKAQLDQEGNHEAQLFGDYNNWCDSEVTTCKDFLATTQSTMNTLEAFIEEQKAVRAQLGSEIKSLIQEVTDNEMDQRESRAQRDKEHKEYMAAETTFVKSIDSLERSLQVLEKQQPASMVQRQSNLVSLASSLKHTLANQLNGAQQKTLDDFFKTTMMMQTGSDSQSSSDQQPVSYRSARSPGIPTPL